MILKISIIYLSGISYYQIVIFGFATGEFSSWNTSQILRLTGLLLPPLLRLGQPIVFLQYLLVIQKECCTFKTRMEISIWQRLFQESRTEHTKKFYFGTLGAGVKLFCKLPNPKKWMSSTFQTLYLSARFIERWRKQLFYILPAFSAQRWISYLALCL